MQLLFGIGCGAATKREFKHKTMLRLCVCFYVLNQQELPTYMYLISLFAYTFQLLQISFCGETVSHPLARLSKRGRDMAKSDTRTYDTLTNQDTNPFNNDANKRSPIIDEEETPQSSGLVIHVVPETNKGKVLIGNSN